MRFSNNYNWFLHVTMYVICILASLFSILWSSLQGMHPIMTIVIALSVFVIARGLFIVFGAGPFVIFDIVIKGAKATFAFVKKYIRKKINAKNLTIVKTCKTSCDVLQLIQESDKKLNVAENEILNENIKDNNANMHTTEEMSETSCDISLVGLKSEDKQTMAEDENTNENTSEELVNTDIPNLKIISPESYHDKKYSTLKKYFSVLIEKKIGHHLASEKDSEILFDNLCRIFEKDCVEESEIKKVQNKDLKSEDIYHLGFLLKYYLNKKNSFGCDFIYYTFRDYFKDSSKNTLETKLATNDPTKTYYIKLPPSYTREDQRGKNFAYEGDLESDLEALIEEKA